jgi:molybdenum cofactor biosynthesis enzyme MoaA
MAASLDGTREATFPTISKGATVELCTADIDGTLDGAKDVKVYMVVV